MAGDDWKLRTFLAVQAGVICAFAGKKAADTTLSEETRVLRHQPEQVLLFVCQQWKCGWSSSDSPLQRLPLNSDARTANADAQRCADPVGSARFASWDHRGRGASKRHQRKPFEHRWIDVSWMHAKAQNTGEMSDLTGNLAVFSMNSNLGRQRLWWWINWQKSFSLLNEQISHDTGIEFGILGFLLPKCHLWFIKNQHTDM